jgi:Ca-activated chloride channel family protein
MGPFVLKDPLWLLALALIPLVLWLRGRRRVPVLIVPFAAAWHGKTFSTASRWPVLFAVTGLILLIGALARPQHVQDKREVRSQGYDLILAVDLSGSMLAEDYEKGGQALNRLQAIKPVIQAFINERANDRIGMVVFSSRAYTLAPLTFDHAWLASQTERITIGMIDDTGTAIGDGLGVSLTRLEQAAHVENNQRKGAFIILLTDGGNNCGLLMPAQAADIAKARGIPIYTIGAGGDKDAPVPIMENGRKVGYGTIKADLDQVLLHNIADTTGGHFFRADDLRTIESAFKAIDHAQKIEFQAKSYLITSELFHWLAIPGAILLILGAAMKWMFARTTNPQATKDFATA